MAARFFASQKIATKRSDCRRARRISMLLASAIPQQPTENPSRMMRTARTTGPEPRTMSSTLSWCPATCTATPPSAVVPHSNVS